MRINHRSYLYVFMNQYRHFLSNLTRLSPPCRWLMRIIYRLWLWNFQNSLRFLSIFQINCYRCSDVCFNIFCRATVTWFFEALEKRNDNNNHKNESQNYPPPSSPRYCVSIKWQMMSLKRGQSERSYLNHVTRNSEWKRAVIRRGQKTSSNDNIYQIPLFLCWWWRLFFFATAAVAAAAVVVDKQIYLIRALIQRPHIGCWIGILFLWWLFHIFPVE